MQPHKMNLEQLKQYQVTQSHPLDPRSGQYYQYAPHQQQNLVRKLPIDTPSTSYGIVRTPQKINTVAHKHLMTPEPKVHYQSPLTPPPAQTHTRNPSNILTVK